MAATTRPKPASPSEAIAQNPVTRYGRDVSRPSTTGSAARRWLLRAHLFGGGADGRAVHLDSLIPEIAVYLSERGTVACDQTLPHRGEGRFVGVYRLATAGGPEPPVYVAAA